MSSGRWNDEFLESMRHVTDPLADQALQQVFDHGEVKAVNDLMHNLVRNDQIIPDQFPPSIQHYFEESGQLPDWADGDKIRAAEKFFARHGIWVSLALYFSSLPTCYACARGVRVLHLTARLFTDPRRRIAETGQMVLDVMAPGGLSQKGKGIRDVQKVRLMHAAVRHLIVNSEEWNQAWGEPVNQEDMAGTLLSFSLNPQICLPKLGVQVERQETESYLHTWNVVGHIMGIHRNLLPDNAEEAKELAAAIGRRNYEPSDEGRAMTSALIEMFEEILPGTVFDGLPSTMIRHLSGDRIADLLGVSNDDWTEKLVSPFKMLFNLMEEVNDRSVMLAQVSEYFMRAFFVGMPWIDRGGERAPFEIPAALREGWNLKPHPGA
jgi:ER-bound oxygenase mpaB/B'/Rubber oxygenase, catalytic domain